MYITPFRMFGIYRQGAGHCPALPTFRLVGDRTEKADSKTDSKEQSHNSQSDGKSGSYHIDNIRLNLRQSSGKSSLHTFIHVKHLSFPFSSGTELFYI